MRSTAVADRFQNWRARGARQGCDSRTNRELDLIQEYWSGAHGWEWWFEIGDEIV